MLERDAETLTWAVVGDDERAMLSAGRQRILAWLDEHPEGGDPRSIASSLDMSYDSVRQFLSQMLDAGQVARPQRGRYTLGAGATNSAA